MTDQLVHLDPAAILAEANIRYALTKADIAQMKAAIAEQGGVTTPVEVEELLEDNDQGFTHRLTVGFRRHAAALDMNRNEGAGLTIPAIVRPLGGDTILRLKHQLSENIDRKNLSPMDQASSIKSLIDAGLSRLQVREMFKRPTGKKASDMQPASNAWLNMTLSFLDLPKAIRDDIHAGTVGVAAAYELTKVSPEKQAEVLEKAKAARQADIDREAKEEEKYLKTESKLQEAIKTEETTATELDLAQAELELAKALVKKTSEATVKAYKEAKTAKGDDKKKTAEHHKAAETDLRAAQKAETDAFKKLGKLQEVRVKATETAKDMRDRLAEVRAGARQGKAGRAKGAAVGPQDVKAAAKASGEDVGLVKLNAAQMRKAIEDLTLAGTFPNVAKIGKAILDCFNSVTTPGEMLKALAKVTGETAAKAPAKAPAVPAKKKTD